MARETFVDTSGFYALLATDDSQHKRAAAWLKQAEDLKIGAVTTDYVLDETATLIKAKGHGHLLNEFFRRLDASEMIRIVWTTQGVFSRARQFFLRHYDHDYSFTDCVSFTVMKDLKLEEVLSKDRHFREAGFKPLLLE